MLDMTVPSQTRKLSSNGLGLLVWEDISGISGSAGTATSSWCNYKAGNN